MKSLTVLALALVIVSSCLCFGEDKYIAIQEMEIDPPWKPPTATPGAASEPNYVAINGIAVATTTISLKEELRSAAVFYWIDREHLTLRRREVPCVLRRVYSYSINNSVFAYEVPCFAISIDKDGTILYQGAAYVTTYYDEQGDGRFSTARFGSKMRVPGWVAGGSALLKQIQDTIAKVRSDKTVVARAEAAEHLAGLTQDISSKEVTEALVTDLTSLLDSPDDSVRYWVATAVGNLGPAAKSAVPKLEELLPKADCINGAITSASAIRRALLKMGVKPPPLPKCERTAG